MENTSPIEQHDKIRTSVRTQLLFEVVTWYEVNNSTAQPIPPVKVLRFSVRWMLVNVQHETKWRDIFRDSH